MNSAERDAIFRSRLRSLEQKAQTIGVLQQILRGQLTALERELAVSLELLDPASQPLTSPAPMIFRGPLLSVAR
jgi:hypothetical protein